LGIDEYSRRPINRSPDDDEIESWFGHSMFKPAAIPSVVDFISNHCPNRYLVTLTDRRKLSAEQLTSEVRRVIHITNKAYFGTHYTRRRRVFLATYTAQEMTINEGRHAHIVVGVPSGSLVLKPFAPAMAVPEFLVTKWVEAAPTYRRPAAQDWRPANVLAGAISYIEKTFKSDFDIENLDVENTTFPTAYSAPR
jgi:hypothetical protein